MTADDIRRWYAEGKGYTFYHSHEWQALKRQILYEQHGECEWCRERGIITPAETVHHVMHVREHPELALSRTYRDRDGVEHKNLIALCHDCHDKAHGRMRYQDRKKKFLTEEKW